MSGLRVVRLVSWAVVALCIVAAAAFAYSWYGKTTTRQVAAIGGPFSLVDTKGAVVTDKSFLGHPSLVYFGYTYCPDVCPTTLSDMTTWLKALGPDADRLKAYFVTIDPERDTAQQIAMYLTAFDPRIVGVTGAPDAVDAMLKAYRVYHRKVGDGDNYTVDHAAALYLLDSRGEFSGSIDYQEPTDQALAKIKRLLNS